MNKMAISCGELFQAMKLTNKGWIKLSLVLLVSVFIGIYFSWNVTEKRITHVNFTRLWSDNLIAVVPKYAVLSNSSQESLSKTYTVLDQQYDLRIIAIVYNRAKSLQRLLKSINEAEYGTDSVKLEVWIDRSVDGNFDLTTFDVADSFNFSHGQYSVYVHSKHVGIYGQWLTTWKPKINSSEIAVILEDDLTVSPHFYKYLKLVHKKYDNIEEINGYALQGSSIKHYVHDTSVLVGPKDSHVFLYPVLGTWGFSPCTKNWIKFIDWFPQAHNDQNFVPIIPDNIVSSWYKEFMRTGKTEGIWSIWHIYFAWKETEYTLYCNFKGNYTCLFICYSRWI